ncbi:hypothetical protein SCALM49S_08060 [Streptomyces californicus]
MRLRPAGVGTGPAMTRAPARVSASFASSTSFTAMVAPTLRSTSSSDSGPLISRKQPIAATDTPPRSKRRAGVPVSPS